MQTLYLLAQDFGHNFRFSYVDVHHDPDWIALTYDMRTQYEDQKTPIIVLFQGNFAFRMTS